MTTSLAQKAMLVSLNISSWQARKQDKSATATVQQQSGSKEGTGRYNKTLIAKEALKTVQATIGAARTFHYTNTLPWNDNGARILPAANFLPYTEEMRKLKGAFQNAVNALLDNYPALVQEAKGLLGSLYNETDYPSASQISRKFDFDFFVDPLPDAGDFRVTLQSDEVQAIQAQIKARVEAAQQTAMTDLWDRLKDVLGKVEERLSDSEKTFHDSLIGNVAELTDLIPRLNITGDRKLTRTVALIEDKIATLDPASLRSNPIERKDAAKDAKAILDLMAGYCGG